MAQQRGELTIMRFVSSQTVVQPIVRLRRERLLPYGGEVTVETGQHVSPVQVVARAVQRRGFSVIPVAELLGVPAEKVGEYLLVEEGTTVSRGMQLAHRPGLGRSKRIDAPSEGVLYLVRHGRLVIQQQPTVREVRAMLHGHVTRLIGNRGVIIETVGSLVQAAWTNGYEGYGKLQVVTDAPDGILDSRHLSPNVRGAVLVAGRVESGEVLDKAAESSVRGVIVGSMPAALLPQVEQLGLPILVTERFGKVPMATAMFTLFSQAAGREACLLAGDPAARRGRPEIVVPAQESADIAGTEKPVLKYTVGQQVRVLQGPTAGETGKVRFVSQRGRRVNSGLRVAGVEVALASGRVEFVPYENLDLVH